MSGERDAQFGWSAGEMPGLDRLQRLVETVRHLEPEQWIGRATRLLRGSRWIADDYPRREPVDLSELPTPFAAEIEQIPDRAERVVDGWFEFVGREPVCAETVDWSWAPGDDPLWRFNLHYCGWVLDLARAWRVSEDERYASRALDAMSDWIASHPQPTGAAWHPYPLSRRLPNWCVALSLLEDAPGWDDVAGRVAASIERQASYLDDWPEIDLGANHLLSNYWALAWVHLHLDELGGVDVPAARGGPTQFWSEFESQIEADGGHVERSTSYHVSVCRDALELSILADRAGRAIPSTAERALTDGFDFLSRLIRPEGRAPQLNDSVPGYPIEPRDLLAAAAVRFEYPDWRCSARDAGVDYLRWLLGGDGEESYRKMDERAPERTAFEHPETGYAVVRQGWESDSEYLLFDRGPIGPDSNPGHAHADTLQILLSVHGVPILVDPGAHTYREGPDRAHSRSTFAHNTVCVDGSDQSEMWGAFRVGRRARVEQLDWNPERGAASALHDGYDRLESGVHHRRAVGREDPGEWRVRDRLESEGGTHVYQVTWQLSPVCESVEVRGQQAVVTFEGGVRVDFEFDAVDDLAIEVSESPIAVGWNETVSAPTLRAELHTRRRRTVIDTWIRVSE
ncbi:MAG: heparinase II/III family protein [Bradymonadaceae bacterium]